MKKLIIILGVVGTAFSAIFVRYATASSTVLVFYRMLFSVLLICPSVLISHRKEFAHIKFREFGMCMLSGLFLGFHFYFYFESLNHTSISSSVVLVDTEVFFVALGGILFLKEKVSAVGWISIFITFIGSVIVACGDMQGGKMLGDILAICGAVCSAVYTLIGKKCRANMSTTIYTWIVYFFAGMVTLFASVFSKDEVLHCGMNNLAAALGMAVFCTLLGHSIYSWGLKYEKSSFISTVKLLEPVFASVLGMIIFMEIPSVSSVIGGIIIICGIILCVYAQNKKQDY